MPDSEINSTLVNKNAEQKYRLQPDAINAWNAQLPTLKEAMQIVRQAIVGSSDWHLLLEYPIPQIGKRIDAVLLARNIIIVIETKTGLSPNTARRQAEDYAISLACFHEASAGRTIVPLVVSDAGTSSTTEQSAFEQLVQRCNVCKSSEMGETLLRLIAEHAADASPDIDPRLWDLARFLPVPSIIEAAVKLYGGMDVFEIGHAAAPKEDLNRTTDALLRIAKSTKQNNEKAICFVTGVPGAGKTLVGLNAVHHTDLKDTSMFLSGNGPLVKIIREALARDVIDRERQTRRSAETALLTFVANVHRFADEFIQPHAPEPTRNVIVFDEAQRAWDKEQNSRPSRSGNRAKRPDMSEPHMLLEIMNRRKDWALVIALVGGGQEINRGEAGLSEWGRSLQHYPKWRVYADTDVLNGSIRANGFQLFAEPDEYPERTVPDHDLHLRTNVRSIRARGVADWVDAVLAGESTRANTTCSVLSEKPVITRSLVTTRDWLRKRRIGLTRSGLVSSAHAARLRADGLEPSFDFHRFYEWEHWFLDRHCCEEPDCNHKYCGDVRASSKLEVSATQFEIQGLELDWVGVCWSEDLVWSGTNWISQKFDNKRWSPVRPGSTEKQKLKIAAKHLYRVNAYRVLLTRARQGMIVYIPDPVHTDTSRSHLALNRTYQFLVECGAVPIE